MSSDGTGVEVLVDDIYGLIHLTDEFAIKWWGGNVTYNCSGGNVTERHSNYYKEELATGETINITSYYADWKALIKDVDPDRGKLLYSLYLLDHIDHDGNICGIWDFTPGIHEMSFDGSEKVLVIPSSRLDNETLTNPHYFMDGSCILFTSGGQYYPQQAYLFERDTGEIEKITDIDRTDHYYAGISVLGEQRVLISVTDSAGSPEFHVDTYQSLYIYDRRTNTTEAVYENSSLNVVSHSPDGRYLVCLSDFGDGDIVLFDVRE